MAMTGEARAIIVTNSVFLVLAWISVGLRLVARKKYGNTLGADDYYIIAALVWIFQWGDGSCCKSSLYPGFFDGACRYYHRRCFDRWFWNTV